MVLAVICAAHDMRCLCACVCVCPTITLLLLMVICGWILRVIAFIQSRTRDIRLFLIAGFIDRESLHLASVGGGGGRTPLEQAEQQRH